MVYGVKISYIILILFNYVVNMMQFTNTGVIPNFIKTVDTTKTESVSHIGLYCEIA